MGERLDASRGRARRGSGTDSRRLSPGQPIRGTKLRPGFARPLRPQALATAEPTDSQPVSAASRAPEIGAAAPVAVLAGPGARFETVATRPGASRAAKPAPALSRQPAENLRLRAALARIEAGRLNAQETAGDLFGEGRHNEEEGERLLRQHEYPAAELAFSRAARLFQKAQEISWERRLRESDLSSAQ